MERLHRALRTSPEDAMVSPVTKNAAITITETWYRDAELSPIEKEARSKYAPSPVAVRASPDSICRESTRQTPAAVSYIRELSSSLVFEASNQWSLGVLACSSDR